LLSLLIVEDSTTDAKLVVQHLRAAGHEVVYERVEDEPGLSAALERGRWDAVLCDWSMPRFSAGAALAVLKRRQLDLPFIIVSGTVGEEAAVDAMRAGAHDYVLKDRLARLLPALERELRERALREANRLSAAALAASEARFERLSESGIIGIVLSDQEGQLREANDTFLRLVGLARIAIADGNIGWAQLTPPGGAAAAERQAAALREHGVCAPYETECLRPDGTRVAVLIGAARLSDSRSIAFIVDRSAQQRAEAELARSVEQLRHAQKMEAVGRLAGGVAHDFNNLLSVILGYSSLLADKLQPADPLRENVEQINAAGLRAAALTRQLLTFSRQQPTGLQRIDLGALLGGMEAMLRRVLGEDVDLLFKVEPRLGAVDADPANIEQVIMNLVVNARDAMPTGGKLTLEAKNVELDEAQCRAHLGATPGPHVLIVVSDTGEGMDAKTRAHVFEPFFTTKEKGKGTGLGLSTVYGIVQQCKGSIWLYSEPGVGTTFKIYLPRSGQQPGERRATPAVPLSSRGTERILLVEDEAPVRAVARIILQRLGYQVHEASDAAEALLKLETGATGFDLLLTDVVMPNLSGPELVRRALGRWPHLKALCMSGYSEEAALRNGASEGSIPYLQKPLTPDTLGRKVREVLDGAATGKGSEEG
jgi:PAS domain S-box-containing protein